MQSSLCAEILCIFKDMVLPDEAVDKREINLRCPRLSTALAKPQVRWSDATMRGRSTLECGPEWMGQKRMSDPRDFLSDQKGRVAVPTYLLMCYCLSVSRKGAFSSEASEIRESSTGIAPSSVSAW